MSPRMVERMGLGLLLAYFGILFHGILFMTDGLFERDGFYHAAFARMLPSRGLSRSFPWTQFSSWKDHFADKELVYHVLLSPFCAFGDDPLPGAKIGCIVLALGLLLVFHETLDRLATPWPLAWTALLPSASGVFLSRMLMIRSHVLSIILMVAGTALLVRGRRWAVFALAFVYSWSYTFPIAILLTAVAAAVGLLLGRTPARDALRLPAIVLLGIVAGLVIHPYSPNSFNNVWVHANVAFGGVSGGRSSIGTEFRPASPGDVWADMPLVVVMAGAGAALATIHRARGGRLEPDTLAVGCAALGWMAGMAIFLRMAEYFVPIAVMAAALVVRDVLGRATPPPGTHRVPRFATALLATLAIGVSQRHAQDQVIGAMLAEQPQYGSEERFRRGRYFDGAAAWMRAHLPSGTLVVNFDWDDFPELFYSAPEERYLVGLDPTFMRLSHPREWEALEAMRSHAVPVDLPALREIFGASYMIVRHPRVIEFDGLIHPIVMPVFSDDGASIFSLPDRSRIPPGGIGPARPDVPARTTGDAQDAAASG